MMRRKKNRIPRKLVLSANEYRRLVGLIEIPPGPNEELLGLFRKMESYPDEET